MFNLNCSNCNEVFNYLEYNFFCPNCKYLNPLNLSINKVNYFSYLMLQKEVFIDKVKCEANYLKLMSLIHPDRFITKSKLEQENAFLHSSFLNQASATLLNDLTRIEYLYLLKTNQILIKEEDSNLNNKMNLAFFEWYEELEEVTSETELANFLVKLQNLRTKHLKNIDSYFTNLEYNKIKEEFITVRYIDRITEKSQLKFLK